PALQRVAFDEGLLQIRDLAAGIEALDGDDVGAVGLHRQHQAAPHQDAVDPQRAGAADAVFATKVRAGQSKLEAQEVDEMLPHRHQARHAFAVDGEADHQPLLAAHAALPSWRDLVSASASARRVSTRCRCRRMLALAWALSIGLRSPASAATAASASVGSSALPVIAADTAPASTGRSSLPK